MLRSRRAIGSGDSPLHACPRRTVLARGTRADRDRLQRVTDRGPPIDNERSGGHSAKVQQLHDQSNRRDDGQHFIGTGRDADSGNAADTDRIRCRDRRPVERRDRQDHGRMHRSWGEVKERVLAAMLLTGTAWMSLRHLADITEFPDDCLAPKPDLPHLWGLTKPDIICCTP
jgi:hypothetical protein